MAGLLFGITWFWTLLTIAFIVIMISLENKRWGGTGATLTMILFFGALYFLQRDTFYGIKDFIIEHPIKCLLYILGYISIGILWSFVKWYYFLLRYRDKVDKSYQHWKSYIPKASENKGKIIAWMTYWPMSGLWTIINDPVRRLYNRIYGKIEKVYQKISDRVFKD